MAMIYCGECKRSISDKAATCPGCGAPVATKAEEDKPKGPGPTPVWVWIVVVLAVGIGALCVIPGKKEDPAKIDEGDRPKKCRHVARSIVDSAAKCPGIDPTLMDRNLWERNCNDAITAMNPSLDCQVHIERSTCAELQARAFMSTSGPCYQR